ncbi:uncharacterized protein B0416.5-like [Portunus trituberculatus]|uniref:uncharacterized protein B0416.5-like n=1 Tax=Portunus trituberculatus TaxID=210409 RepID=UPI001E1CFAF1|nr:uncharacterized protein B0416.5-like [Portunus trituberculatus]XP_045126688.1 uncharacterized protein B0416.5-like [Portunus trituberculatus]
MGSLSGDNTSEESIGVVVGGAGLQEDRGRGSSPLEGSTPHSPADTTYRVYRQRWLVLLTVVVLNISNAGLWINIAPVSYKAAAYFDVNITDVNWFSLVFLFVSIPFCFISTLSVNQLGLKPAIHIGSILNCAGAVTRAVATAGFLPEDVVFPLCLTGQVIAAMAQSFLLFIPTKVSQLWFPETSRAVSTTILSMSNPLGILVTQVVSPLIVTEKENIPTLNYVFGGLAIFSLLTTLVCVTRSMPPTPPSHSAARGERDRAPYLQQLKETFTSVPYLLLLLALGCGIALFSSLATVTQQILCPLGYNDLFSGVAMAVMILCGFVGSAVTGVAADRTKAFTPITKLFYGCAAIFAIFMMEMFLVPGQPTLVAIACGLFGFFGVGVYPIGLELAVETTFPVEESISTAFIFMSGQAQGVIIIGMVTLLSRDQLAKYSHLEVCTGGESSDLRPRDYSVSLMAIMGLLSFMVILVIIFFNTPYKRLEAEKASTSNISSSSNQSLTATSGYGSECVSRNTTTSSRVSRHRPTVLPEDVNETPEGGEEYEQCHL